MRFESRKGKGSHGRRHYGDRFTTVKDRRKEIGQGLLAAKIALYRAMRERGLGNAALARELGTVEGTVRRLLDLDHRSHIGQVEAALHVLGQRLVVAARAG